MNNNTNNSNGNIPEAVLELLPWYAIGKLSVDDQVMFEKALVKYPLLEELLSQELDLIETVSANKSLLDLSAIAAPEERLKSVLNMIEIAEAQNPSKANCESEISISLIDKLKKAFNAFISTKAGTPQYARLASVAVLVLSVAALTAFITPLFTDKSDYIPASAVVQPNSDQKSKINNASQTVLLVGFNGTSTELGNNNVLKDKLSKIESVPNKEGVFQISFKQPLSTDEITQVIGALMEQDDLIWFAGEEF